MLFLGLWGYDSYAAPLIGGLPLGIGGTAFAVGVLFENRPPPHLPGPATLAGLLDAEQSAVD